MSVDDRMAEVRRLVEEARAMPMSASVMVNRGDLLAALGALEGAVHQALVEAREVTAAKDEVVDEGHREVQGMVAAARDAQDRMTSETEVLRSARERADSEVETALREADALREEADAYVDHKLAGFEVALERTLETVRRGRERLAARDAPGARAVDPDEAEDKGEGGFW